jgi:hypothetical protein
MSTKMVVKTATMHEVALDHIKSSDLSAVEDDNAGERVEKWRLTHSDHRTS